MKTEIFVNSPQSLALACALLESSEVVALPTETVYGLAGNAFDETSVRKIFLAKSRPYFDPLIVHLSRRYLTAPEGLVPALIRDGVLHSSLESSPDRMHIDLLAKRFWPGPLTLVLPRGALVSDIVTGNQSTVAIRIPAHEVFQSVLRLLPFPLAAPSANRFGRISPTTADHVESELGGRIAGILDGGPCSIGVESTILKLENGEAILLRPGGIPSTEIGDCIGRIPRSASIRAANPEAPGMLDEHYAPGKPLILIPEPIDSHRELPGLLQDLGKSERLGLLIHAPVKSNFDLDRFKTYRILSPTGSDVEAAKNLFSFLRELDGDPFIDVIIADLPSDHSFGIFAAIADRLQRASRNKPSIPHK
ncbi:MAG: L-threonylcarbamoyladenylate synthase [Bdellovibrionales bacterium]|nr:L-threonylcarbamoyladenylate synthase [Bdellovibrionales bacterium]